MTPFEQLMEFMKNKKMNTVFRWITKRKFALIEPKKDRISLNIYLMLTNYFVHEFMHYKNPILAEKEIWEKTENFVERMTVAEIKKFGEYLTKTIPLEK